MKWARSYGMYKTGKIHLVDEINSRPDHRKAICNRSVILGPMDIPEKIVSSKVGKKGRYDGVCAFCLKKAGLSENDIGTTGELHTLELTPDEVLDIIIQHHRQNNVMDICKKTAVMAVDKNHPRITRIRWVDEGL